MRALIGVLLVLATQASLAAVVANVQSGTLTSTGNGTQAVTLGQTVDMAKSVLFFHTRNNSNRPPGSMVRGRLAAPGSLTFTRVSNESASIAIHWYLVEFSSGVNVQRGQFSQTGTTMNINLAIPVASMQQAFVMWSKTPAAGDTSWSRDGPIGALLTDTSTIRFYTGGTNNNHVIDYQVVEYTDAADINVQSGTQAMGGGGNTVRNITLATPVNTGSSFVLAGFTTPAEGADVGERMLRAELIDASTVRFTRQASGDNINRIVWQAIELNDGTTVQHGLESFSNGQAVQVVNLPTAVDSTRSVAFSGMQPVSGQNMGSSNYVSDDVIGTGSFTFDLSDTTLSIQRSNSASSAAVGWFVIEFGGFSPLLDVRMDERQWSGTAGEVVDAASGLNGTAVNGAVNASGNPAIAGDPGTCRYGDFDGSDDYLEFADDPLLDASAELTASIWINPRTIPGSGLKSIVSKDTNYEFHLNSAGQIFWWWNDSGGTTRSFNSTATVNANQWHHVAITYRSGEQIIYLDGVNVGSQAYAGNLANNNLPLQVGQDQNFPGRFWNGLLDELRIYDQALTQTEVQSVMAQTQPCPVSPRGEWHFDETGWNGTPDEVVEYSGNDFHGVATNAVTDVGQVCNAADLDATGTSDYLTLDAAAFDGLGDFTIGAWVRTTQNHDMAVVSGARVGQDNELIFWFIGGNRFRPYLRGGQSGTINMPGLNDGNWHFVVWTRSGASNCGYLDDALRGCVNLSATPLSISSVIVGQEQDNPGGAFATNQALDGEIDELILFDTTLSQPELATIRANNLAGFNWDGTPRVCPITGATGFIINHDNTGIACLDEPIQVTAVDAASMVVTSYGNEITLTTSSNRGSWTLVAGGGTFNDATLDDGQATYMFAGADNGSAIFALAYPEGSSPVDVDAYQSDDVTIRDDESEGTLIFAPTGFTLTANALGNPPPSPINDPLAAQIAGTNFPMHIAAFGVTDDDPLCGVIESYSGPRPLKFFMSYDNPNSGTRVATVDGLNAGTALAQNVAFAAGQAQVTVKYKDAGGISLSAQDDTSFSNVVSGGSNSFVVKPATLVVSRIETAGGGPNLGAGTPTGPQFVAAGEAFVVDVDARDAEGTITPNFGLEAVPETVLVRSANLVLPVGGRNGSSGDILNGAAFVASATAGRFTNTNIRFDEVGVVQLLPELTDGDYLGAGPVLGTLSGNVGRFYPGAFELVSDTLNAACVNYTYMDQPALDLDYRLQARSTLGNVTENYDETLLGVGAVAPVVHLAEASDDGVNRGGRLSPIAARWVLGEVVADESALNFTRVAGPDGPFDPLQLGLQVVDTLDGVALGNLNMNAGTSGDCILAANCDAHTLGVGTRIVYGRLMVLPSYGPENLDLDVALEAQAFDAGVFQQHQLDNCSSYAAALASLDPLSYMGNLDSGETNPLTPLAGTNLVNGADDVAAPLTLSAPGLGNDGSVNVILDVPSWLEFDWLGSGARDPEGPATFGRFRGHDRIIYWSEQ